MILASIAFASFLGVATPAPAPANVPMPCVVVFGHTEDAPLLKLLGYAEVSPEGVLRITQVRPQNGFHNNFDVLRAGEAAFPPFGWQGIVLTPAANCDEEASIPQGRGV